MSINCAERISVAMAVYNGEKYIREQIDSILLQLRDEDELIISYNDSIDDTWRIIQEYEATDARVKCYKCKIKGVINNFNNALAQATGEIVFLADQDDIWLTGKFEEVTREFEKDEQVVLVMHNCNYVNAQRQDIGGNLFQSRKAGPGYLKNLFINSYQGCCMAFKRELVKRAVPVPGNVVMHDQWLGLCAEHVGKVVFLDKKLIDYRLHGGNVSVNRRSWREFGAKLKEVSVFIHAFMQWKASDRKRR